MDKSGCSCKSPLKPVILCSDKKGKVPRLEFLPSEIQVLAKRRGSLHHPITPSPAPSLGPPASTQAQPERGTHVSWQHPYGPVPDPAQPSPLGEPGSQDPANPQAFYLNWRESLFRINRNTCCSNNQVNPQLTITGLL